jgi:hypothetical protein
MRRTIVLALVLVSLLAFAPPADAQDPVAVNVRGPDAIAPSSTHPFTVTVTGGPAAHNGTFHIEYTLLGDNLFGADPQAPRTLANREGVFNFNVTAPEAEGTIVLYVKATSEGDVNETEETRYPIDVFRPLDLRATIRNNGAAAALNVIVFFYVDNVLVGNSTLARVDAGGEATANVTYIPVGLAPGRHTVRIQADLDGDGKFLAERGELLAYDFFYKTERTSVPAILGTLAVLFLIVLLFILLAIRRQRRLGS